MSSSERVSRITFVLPAAWSRDHEGVFAGARAIWLWLARERVRAIVLGNCGEAQRIADFQVVLARAKLKGDR